VTRKRNERRLASRLRMPHGREVIRQRTLDVSEVRQCECPVDVCSREISGLSFVADGKHPVKEPHGLRWFSNAKQERTLLARGHCLDASALNPIEHLRNP
jgi:hypothetical protein